jgi:F0F1-type ATP synthase assembly protein I
LGAWRGRWTRADASEPVRLDRAALISVDPRNTFRLSSFARSRRQHFLLQTSQVNGKTPKKLTGWRQVGMLTSIPFILALAPLIGLAIGFYLDRHFRTKPWLGIVFCVLGFVAGVRETINIIKLSQLED